MTAFVDERIRAVYCFPEPPKGDVLALVKRAKAELGLDYLVSLTAATPDKEPDRVLAFGVQPTFVCDAAIISDVSRYESVLAALRWVLTAPADSRDGWMREDALSAFMGVPVTYRGEEAIAA